MGASCWAGATLSVDKQTHLCAVCQLTRGRPAGEGTCCLFHSPVLLRRLGCALLCRGKRLSDCIFYRQTLLAQKRLFFLT